MKFFHFNARQMALPFVLLFMAFIGHTCQAQTVHQEAPPQLPSLTEAAKLELIDQLSTMTLEKNQLANQIGRSKQSLNEALKRRASLMEKPNSIGISPESIDEVMRSLHSQNIQLQIDLAGLEARREFLQQASEQLKISASQNEVTAASEKLLKIAQKRFDRFGAGSASDARQAAERELLQAKIRLAEAKRGDSRLSKISDDLYETALARAEKTARLETLDTLLDSIAPVRAEVETANRMSIQIDEINASIVEYEKELQDLEGELSLVKLRLQNSKNKE